MYTENDPLITTRTLVADLQRLGLRAGMTVMVHSSVKKITGTGYIVGGLQAILEALMQAVTPEGTLVMPTHNADSTDPGGWSNPPVPESWWETIRNEYPAFDPVRTPSWQMGALPELFRTWPDVIRSRHPNGSCAAWGKHAHYITAGDPLTDDMGDDGPIGRIYEKEGYVLLLGVGHFNNTSLHLGEFRGDWQGKQPEKGSSVMMVDGERKRVEIAQFTIDNSDFDQAGAAFEAAHPELIRIGTVGAAESRFMPQRPLVDFATRWFEANRPASLQD
jgi:aminoglycoside 3-N-acetyltransferase